MNSINLNSNHSNQKNRRFAIKPGRKGWNPSNSSISSPEKGGNGGRIKKKRRGRKEESVELGLISSNSMNSKSSSQGIYVLSFLSLSFLHKTNNNQTEPIMADNCMM